MTRALGILFGLGGLALAACGGSSPKSNGTTGAAGSSSTGAGGSTGAAGTAGPACQVNILPISPTSFDGLVAGPSAVMRVRGEITGPVSPLFEWKWAVSLADGSPVPVTIVKEASLVEFSMLTVGTYTIAVELVGSSSPCTGAKTITAAKPGGHVATFRLRVTPPSTQLLPAQELERQVVGGTPSGGNVLPLDPGIIVGFDVARADNGDALPSYVRLTDVVSGAVLETRTSQGGPNTLRVAQGMYTTLVVPDGDVAPMTYPARSPAQIGPGILPLDDGAMITGTVADGAGNAIMGATVVLRAGDLVSTTGTTDATGAFHVRARAGTYGLTVVSTLAGGGLESKLAAAGGLVVDPTAPLPPLTIKVQPGPLVTGTVALSAMDPTSLSSATRVTLGAMAPLPNVATLAVGAGAPRPLAGDIRFSLHPAADGTLTTGGVPRGVYRLTVFPASATTNDGVTTTTLDLTTGNLGPLAVSLAQKVMLTGNLLPSAMAAGVHLVALDNGGLPVVAAGDAGPDGAFAILVSPDRSYALRAVPRPNQALARTSFPVVTVLDRDFDAKDNSMPAALLYAGRVVDPNLQGVGTALVQAFCEAKTPGCTDATTPVAETVTRSDGTFQLMLPDPDGTP